MSCVKSICRNESGFASDESGASTVWSIFWTVIFLIMAGFVIDTSNAYRFKNILQATADSGASTALMAYHDPRYAGSYWHNDESWYLPGNNAPDPGETRADDMATDITQRIMGTARNGTVTTDAMVEMGNWNGTAFQADVEPINAARVRSERTERNDNRLDTLLLGAFDGLKFWDVGAIAVAHVYEADCPSGEAIMAGGELDLSANNLFVGEICLHGEQKVGLAGPNDFQSYNDAEPGVSFGADGVVCSSVGSPKADTCSPDDFTQVVSKNDGLTDEMISQELIMPDVEDMIANINSAIGDPEFYAGHEYDQFIPQAIVWNQFRDIGVDAKVARYEQLTLNGIKGVSAVQIVVDENGSETKNAVILPENSSARLLGEGDGTGGTPGALGVLELSMSRAQFETALKAAETSGTSLPENAIYRVTDCSGTGGKAISLDENIKVSNIVLHTVCEINFGGDFTLSNSTVFTTYSGSNAAISGSAGATLGDATCTNNARGGSTIVAAGEADIDFSAGLKLNGSEIIAARDVLIAANGDGMAGVSIYADRDVKLTSKGEFRGCPNEVERNRTITASYKLVL